MTHTNTPHHTHLYIHSTLAIHPTYYTPFLLHTHTHTHTLTHTHTHTHTHTDDAPITLTFRVLINPMAHIDDVYIVCLKQHACMVQRLCLEICESLGSV